MDEKGDAGGQGQAFKVADSLKKVLHPEELRSAGPYTQGQGGIYPYYSHINTDIRR